MTGRSSVGIGGRLLLAFLGISALAGIAAVAALLSFEKLGDALDEIVGERMPSNFAALELSRQAERVAFIAPQLASDRTQLEQMQTDRRIRQELTGLDKLLEVVKSHEEDRTLASAIERSLGVIRNNVSELQQLVALHPRIGNVIGNNRSRFDRSNEAERVEALLRTNREAAANLTVIVNRFVDEQRAKMQAVRVDAAGTQRTAKAVLLGTVALSLLCSILIVWLYVGRSIVARLTVLSTSMLSLAQGDLDVPLPVSKGNDEIAQMSDALRTFRDTALEKERIARLKHFLAPQVAEMIVSSGGESILDSHRREVAVLFCDLRGFTAFAEAAQPEEIMELLRDYHAILGTLIHKYQGTLERFTGDGLMCFFNDPLPCPHPCLTAVRLATEMRTKVEILLQRWREAGSHLGFGIGIAYGVATLGRVGFEGRFDYAAIGSVTNLAARLCEQATPGEILIDGETFSTLEGQMKAQSLGTFAPKGFSRPIEVFSIAA